MDKPKSHPEDGVPSQEVEKSPIQSCLALIKVHMKFEELPTFAPGDVIEIISHNVDGNSEASPTGLIIPVINATRRRVAIIFSAGKSDQSGYEGKGYIYITQGMIGNRAEKERQERVAKILDLVKKINESAEKLPFPGIHPEAYTKMKITDNEFPGYTTPIDEIIERCEKEGIKVVTGKHPESGNVFVLPAGSNDIEMDSIAPHQLTIETIQNEYLVELIRLKTKKEI